MFWKINYRNFPRLMNKINSLTRNTVVKGKVVRKGIPRNTVNMIIAQTVLIELRLYIIRNQMRFNKTRQRLGVSGRKTNYVPQNVRIKSINNVYILVDLNIKGIQRNFKPISIVPKNAKWLTIPTDKESFQRSARTFDNLFKPKGKKVLAKNIGRNSIKILYALTKHVFQPRTKMLPSEIYLLNKAANALPVIK